MCLGIPGRIVRRWTEADGAIVAEADFAGELRIVRLNYLPDLAVGDYTIVHAGFALTRLDADEAARTLALMQDVGLLGAAGDGTLVVPDEWAAREQQPSAPEER